MILNSVLARRSSIEVLWLLCFSMLYLTTTALPCNSARSQEIESTKCATDPNDRFTYIEDGEFSKIVGVPTYEWVPRSFDRKPLGMALFVHGLTLHGGRYKVAGRCFAAGNYYALSFDMRGFGRCYYGDPNFAKSAHELRKVDYKKSYENLVELAGLMKKKFPGVPFYAIGESLGATPCLQLASEHPELVDGLIISGPAVKVNPRMMLSPESMVAGLRGLIIDPKFNVNLGFFMKKLVSDDPRVVADMENDPLMRNKLTIAELLETQNYVGKNRKFAAKIDRQLPILLLQGRKDKCVIPKDVVELSKNIGSNDQTLRWFATFSHLLLESKFFKAELIDAISSWFESHEEPHEADLKKEMDELKLLGAEGF